MPDNYDAWKAKVDAYLLEKVGVTLDLEILSWGAYGEKRNAIINGGEYFDIMFSNEGTFFSDIEKGAVLDLTPYLEKTPALVEALPQGLWDVVTYQGGIYAVPTMKDSAVAHYFVWDPEVIKETGLDVKERTTLESIEPVLLKMKENGVNITLDAAGIYQFLGVYDGMGMGQTTIGVR